MMPIMKKVIIILLIATTLFPFAYSWNDCPYGLENDPYPGKCPRYMDTDNDGICDSARRKRNHRNSFF